MSLYNGHPGDSSLEVCTHSAFLLNTFIYASDLAQRNNGHVPQAFGTHSDHVNMVSRDTYKCRG